MGKSEDRGRDFWDKIAAKYSRQPVTDEEVYEHKIQLTQAYLTKDMQVLEFGCGTGSTAIQHAPFVNHYLATDLSERMIEFGKAKADEAGQTNLIFEQSSIEDFSADGRTFDAVLALNILHLCHNPRQVIEKVKGLVRPGGLFVQSTPCLKDFGIMPKLAIPVMKAFGKAPHVSFFSSTELYQMMDEAGFHIVKEYFPGGNSADFLIAQRAVD